MGMFVAMVSSFDEATQCCDLLGGMLNYYYREAP